MQHIENSLDILFLVSFKMSLKRTEITYINDITVLITLTTKFHFRLLLWHNPSHQGVLVLLISCKMLVQGRIQDSGAPTYDFAKFREKLHEIGKILGRRGGAGCAPQIRHCSECQILWSLCSVVFHALALKLPILTSLHLPGGCTWSRGCTWSQGVYLVWGGVPGPRVYLVPGGVPGPRGVLGPGGVPGSGLGGVPAQVLLPSPPFIDRMLDTRFWKYYLAPNFVLRAVR